MKSKTINKDHDVQMTAREDLDPEYAKGFKKPWLIQFADGLIYEFDTEALAASSQREWRTQYGRDPMTGEKLIQKVRG